MPPPTGVRAERTDDERMVRVTRGDVSFLLPREEAMAQGIEVTDAPATVHVPMPSQSAAPDASARAQPDASPVAGVAPSAVQQFMPSAPVAPGAASVDPSAPIFGILTGQPPPAPAQPGARPGETFAPLVPPAEPSAPRPRARRAPAPTAAPTDEDRNQATIDQLMGAGPGGERQASPLEQQIANIADGERIARQAAHDEAVTAAERQDVLERAQAQQAELQREREAAMNVAQQRYIEAFEAARSSTVNPHRLLGSAGGMIGVAIATALGGIGAALTGGPNRALQTIERAIDRDIQGQAANQAAAQGAVSDAQSFLAITRQRFDDQQAAQEAARSLAWHQVAERAAQQAAQIRDEGARVRARELEQEARARAQQAAQQAVIAQQDRQLAISRELLEQRNLAAEATIAERRAARTGGAGGGRPPTKAIMEAYNALVDSGYTPDAAAAQLRIAAPPTGRFAGAADAPSEGVRAVNAVLAELDYLERIIPPEGEDIPGVGLGASLLAGVVPQSLEGAAESAGILSPEGQDIRGTIANLADLIGRLRSGAVIGPEEERRFRRMLGAHSETELRRGIARVRREVQGRLGTLQEEEQAAPAPLPAGVRPRE